MCLHFWTILAKIQYKIYDFRSFLQFDFFVKLLFRKLISIIFIIIALAVVFLKGFDRISGRGPKQVSDGIKQARESEERMPCPMCAEKILPQARVCPFCKSNLKE
jgi:hypothetical protein